MNQRVFPRHDNVLAKSVYVDIAPAFNAPVNDDSV